MRPSDYDRSVTGRRHAEEIHERYALAIATWDVHTGRDFGGWLPTERTRWAYLLKCGGNRTAAWNLMRDEEEADRSVGG